MNCKKCERRSELEFSAPMAGDVYAGSSLSQNPNDSLPMFVCSKCYTTYSAASFGITDNFKERISELEHLLATHKRNDESRDAYVEFLHNKIKSWGETL